MIEFSLGKSQAQCLEEGVEDSDNPAEGYECVCVGRMLKQPLLSLILAHLCFGHWWGMGVCVCAKY